jgi:hypothetical protein
MERLILHIHETPKPDIKIGAGRENLNIFKEIIEEWGRLSYLKKMYKDNIMKVIL